MGTRPAIASAAERVQRTCALSDSVSRLRYATGARGEALARLGLRCVRDLLLHVPHRYLDFTRVVPIGCADVGQDATVVATVDRVQLKRPRPRMQIVELSVADETGVLVATFFRQPWVAEQVRPGDRVALSGKVTFGYGEETILRDVTVPVPAGQTIGIVGKSGSGKSTLLKLFLRFWQVGKGRVQLSGRSVEAINTKNLRRMQALVTQETHLFRDSIRNNLLIARPDATDAQLVEACKKASVHDFIAALPQGYDTPVGELGDTLSGGERQRLGLARAFLHDAPFLLLDEPTSNLDSLNEAVILRALEQEHGNRTVVLVSHRASTMGIADTVYSVENGRVS